MARFSYFDLFSYHSCYAHFKNPVVVQWCECISDITDALGYIIRTGWVHYVPSPAISSVPNTFLC